MNDQLNSPGGYDWAEPVRLLPDMADCRVKYRLGDLYDCLVAGPHGCPHALSYGYSFFCLHPDRAAMAIRPRRTD